MSAALALLLAGAVWAEPGAAPCGAAGRAAGAADNPCWTAAFVPAAARAARAAGAGVPGRLCDGAVILNHGARGGAAFGPALQVIALDPARLAARGAGWLVDAAGRARGGRSGARPVRGRGRRRGRRGGGGARSRRASAGLRRPPVLRPCAAGVHRIGAERLAARPPHEVRVGRPGRAVSLVGRRRFLPVGLPLVVGLPGCGRRGGFFVRT